MMKKAILFLASAMLVFSCNGNKGRLLSEATKLLQETEQIGTVEYTIKTIFGNDDSEERWYKIGDRKVLFSSIAHIKAGIDLKNVTEEDILISDKGETVTVTLPRPSILSINIPPESIKEEFYHVDRFRSDFTPQEKLKFAENAQKQIEKSATETDILEKAGQNAEIMLISLFTQLGFKEVIVRYE